MRQGVALAAAFILLASLAMTISPVAAEAPEPDHISADLPIRIDSDAELAVAADYGSGTAEDPWMICDKEINGEGSGIGIFIGNITEYWQINSTAIYNVDVAPNWWWEAAHGIHVYNCIHGEIFNCTINNTNYGICLSNDTSEVSVHDNVIWDCDNRGIAVIYTRDCTFETNTIYGNLTMDFGFSFDGYSDNHTLDGNTIDKTVLAGCGFNDSWYITMTDNTIDGNTTYSEEDGFWGYPLWGVFFYNSWHIEMTGNDINNASYGLMLVGTDPINIFDANIQGNTLHDCLNGVAMTYTDNVTFSGNYVTVPYGYAEGETGMTLAASILDTTIISNYIENYAVGINITSDSVSDITLYDNHLTDNTLHAWDDNSAVNTVWYDASVNEGNWWDDTTGPDTNADGVVDTPRAILGGGSNEDPYPLCTAPTQPSGGAAGTTTILPTIIPEETPDADDSWEFPDLGIVFWLGAGILFLGLVRAPVPYFQRNQLLVIGVILMILSLAW